MVESWTSSQGAQAELPLGRSQHSLRLLNRDADEVYELHCSGCGFDTTTVRAIHRRDEIMLVSHARPGVANYDGDRLDARRLTIGEWSLILRKLREVDFWSLSESERLGGLDGFFWTFRRRRGDEYHEVERWCPKGPFAELGMLMVELAGVTSPTDGP